tara:strand:- start:102 stop:365 length:264 start_codon:yes stop_codon:yes gene_type:complete
MMNMKERVGHFVTHYGEMSAAYNERYLRFDPIEVLEEGWTNDFIGLKKGDLPEVLELFNKDFLEVENEYRYVEVKAIRKWISAKYNA